MGRRSLFVVFLVLNVFNFSRAQDKTANPDEIPTLDPPMASREVGGSYWHIDGNFESVLHIKNVLETSELTVTPVLWMADGTEYDLAPIPLQKAESVSINIAHAIADAPSSITRHASLFGSAGIRYSWNWRDAAIAHVSTTDEINSLTYITHASAAIAPNPDLTNIANRNNVIEGMWWLHTKNVVPFVTFVNTSKVDISAHILILSGNGDSAKSDDTVVAAGETQIVKLDRLIRALSVQSDVGGVQVSYTGKPGTLVVEGGQEDFDAGYSSSIPLMTLEYRRVRKMISPKAVTFAAVGVQVGVPEARMQFPQDTTFLPYSYVRNLSSASMRLHLSANYTSAGIHKVDLGSVLVGGGQTLRLDLQHRFLGTPLAEFSGEINLMFDFDGNAEDLIVEAGSTAKDATFVFNVDPALIAPETGKIFCDWEVGHGTDTMFSFWNSGTTAEDSELILFFRRGSYRLPIHLEPNESRAINLASLINSKVADADGHTIPNNVMEGSARLTNSKGRRTVMGTKAHVSIFNVETATCKEPCEDCDNVVSAILTPPAGNVSVGATLGYVVTAKMKNGETFNANGSTTFSSSNTGIATIASGGTASGINVGSSTISARDEDTGNPSWAPGSLCNFPIPSCPVFIATPTAPINVQQCPSSVSVGPITTMSLAAAVPTWLTGIGIVVGMQVPSNPNSNGTPIGESLTTTSNSCPASFGNICTGSSTFFVGTGATMINGQSFAAVPNQFYDQHYSVSSASELDQNGIASCSVACHQTYTCNGTSIGTFTITRQFTKGVVGPYAVTNVGVTKTAP
ncbi:Ig-like domain-containing protein (plasmid) [Tunturibacter empetritectus]|uniref:Ig-like domain-containing protein n=1 Tax=Tunturiibacter empetritectus TaxID=3069691 RepID=A0AAU7ZKK8_9BACT